MGIEGYFSGRKLDGGTADQSSTASVEINPYPANVQNMVSSYQC